MGDGEKVRQSFDLAGTKRRADALEEAGFLAALQRRVHQKPGHMPPDRALREAAEEVFRALLPEEQERVLEKL